MPLVRVITQRWRGGPIMIVEIHERWRACRHRNVSSNSSGRCFSSHVDEEKRRIADIVESGRCSARRANIPAAGLHAQIIQGEGDALPAYEMR